jgi:hypothetical protein
MYMNYAENTTDFESILFNLLKTAELDKLNGGLRRYNYIVEMVSTSFTNHMEIT